MLDDGEEREGAERRGSASRGASDHRGMERGQTADDLLAIHCDNCDEMLLGQQPYQVIIAWDGMLVVSISPNASPNTPSKSLRSDTSARKSPIGVADRGRHPGSLASDSAAPRVLAAACAKVVSWRRPDPSQAAS